MTETMPISTTITSERIYQAILHGAASIRDNYEELNRINVYPVVDYDTGSNLAHTMNYILSHVTVHETVRDTLRDVARSALISARGNSGAIFSQYFNGLYLASSEGSTLSLTELATCFHTAYEKAFKALENAVEGTIITLMRAWAVGFKEALQQSLSPHELFESTLSRIRTALEDTSKTLSDLKALGLVDAGALGYYYFMEGFVQALLGRKTILPNHVVASTLPRMDQDFHLTSEQATINYRYCTEVLLESDSYDETALRADLSRLGDCLLVAAADNLARIHLHTNTPWEMVRLAATHGNILEQKADDMVLQNLLAGPAEQKIACVTDSIADLPREYVHHHHIFQIPLNILIGQTSYLDKVTIDRTYLYDHLSEASSAQLNREQIQSFLTPILAHYESVLILTVSSKMSGTYTRFKEYIADIGPDASRVALVDTKVNSGAQGLLVQAAVEKIESGMSLTELASEMEVMRSRAKILVSVLDIEPMARSGRVSEKIGRLLIRLHFKPLVSIDPDGHGAIRGIAFSREKNWKLLLRSLKRHQFTDYVIVHADATERAEELRQEMVRLTGHEPKYITDISAIVALFAGRGSVAVAYMEDHAKEST